MPRKDRARIWLGFAGLAVALVALFISLGGVDIQPPGLLGGQGGDLDLFHADHGLCPRFRYHYTVLYSLCVGPARGMKKAPRRKPEHFME